MSIDDFGAVVGSKMTGISFTAGSPSIITVCFPSRMTTLTFETNDSGAGYPFVTADTSCQVPSSFLRSAIPASSARIAGETATKTSVIRI